MYSELLSLPTLDLRRTGPVNISISHLLLSIAYSALLLQDGKLQLLFTPASPQVIKAVPQNKGCNITRWPKFSPPSESYETTVTHSPLLTKMLLCATSHHLFLSCLELGGHWRWREGVHFSVLCPALWILCYHSQDKHNFILESQLFCNRKSLLG